MDCPGLDGDPSAIFKHRRQPAIRAARRAPYGELRIYPGVDHFDIYDGPEHEQVVGDEVKFLQRTLGPRPSSS